ncbi:MAG TPA: hypothetical protein PKX46_00195 [Clostridia bacterium]|nr:hypothetical protein [Clostridia bacterium]
MLEMFLKTLLCAFIARVFYEVEGFYKCKRCKAKLMNGRANTDEEVDPSKRPERRQKP